jgi:hypothetical protein
MRAHEHLDLVLRNTLARDLVRGTLCQRFSNVCE